MFTRQKKHYRTFVYAALLITLCVLVLALLWPKPNEAADGKETVANAQTNTQSDDDRPYAGKNDNQNTAGGFDYDDEKDDDESDDEDKDDDNTHTDKPDDKYVVEEDKDTYYLLKKKGEDIVVFFITESGDEIELETTDIVYDLLPQEDQRNFEEGVKVETQEQLSSLLQDFES